MADVMAGQLAAGGSRPAALLEEWVGEASGRPAGGPVGHRDSGGPLRAQPELSLCGRGSTPLWGGWAGGELPFLKAPRPPASEEHNPTAEQDAREPQHGQHSCQDHAAAPCGDRSALGQAPLQARDAP